MVSFCKLVVIFIAFAAFGRSHPGGEKLHKHTSKPNTIVKLKTNIRSVEALLSKQEERLNQGFQSLTKKVNNMKMLAIRAQKELDKQKMNCSIPLTPPNGHILGLEHDARGHQHLSSNGVVYFVCKDGYHLTGSEHRTCLPNGTWSGEDSSCKDITPKLVSCAKLNCLNGGTCTISESLGKFKCVCAAGFHGRRCQKAARLIMEDESVTEAECTSDGSKDACSCPVGYSIDMDQRRCFDEDECMWQDVSETEIIVIPDDIIGSMAKRHAHQPPCRYQCQNTPGAYKCLCPLGYVTDPALECRDVDECVEDVHNCTGDQRCFNTGGSYQCLEVTCPENYFAESFFVCRRRPCSALDRRCQKQPVTYTYNFIELPSNLNYPSGVFRASADGSSRAHRFTILRGANSKNFKSRRLDDQSAMMNLLRPLNRNQHVTVDFEMKELEVTSRLQAKHVYRITFFQSLHDF